MKTMLFIVSLVFCTNLSAQSPGGIEGAISWVVPKLFEDKAVELWEKKEDELLGLYEELSFFNHNPALALRPEILLEKIKLGNRDLSRLQVFTVYLPQDTILEKAIWSISDAQQDALLMTTHRLADFQEQRFINNLGKRKNQSQINTYQRFKDKASRSDYSLAIGQKGSNSSIPIQNFTGKFAELVIYDRVLSTQQKAQVETYLALKYGIGLAINSGQSMYSSAGQKIWDAQKNVNYAEHVAGLGRDDASGLHQKQSGSVHFGNIFSLALNEFAINNSQHPGALQDQQFLIWGASSDNLSLENKSPGQVQKINKHWQVEQLGFSNELTQLRFQTDELPFEKKANEIFWLVIDHSGKGNFPADKTTYIAQDQVSQEGVAQFSKVSWGENTNHVFSLAVGPALISKVWVDAEDCQGEKSGTFEIGAEGGAAPYRFALRHQPSGDTREWQRSDARTRQLTDMPSGQYQLSILDAEGLRYEENFHINPSDALISQLANEYTLPKGEALVLDASVGHADRDARYTWTLPNGQQRNTPKVAIQQLGKHQLQITSNDCQSKQSIHIHGALPGNIKALSLFPNPTKGFFELLITLHQPSPVEVHLYDPAGRLIKSTQLDGKQRYRYQENILRAGFYFLQITSQEQSETLKLVVHH